MWYGAEIGAAERGLYRGHACLLTKGRTRYTSEVVIYSTCNDRAEYRRVGQTTTINVLREVGRLERNLITRYPWCSYALA